MDTEIDFSHLNRFPGETGNLFDVVLHEYLKVEKIPSLAFAGILVVLASIPTFQSWSKFPILLAFFFSDWLLLAALPRLKLSYGPAKPPVLLLAVLRALFALFPPPWIYIFQAIGTLLLLYSLGIEPFRLQVTEQVLLSPKLKTGKPLRILHIGDLHIERITRREKELQKRIEELQPDLILFSGDILNLSFRDDSFAMDQARQIIKKWQAPLGVYFVNGSPAVDLPENLPNILKGLPVRWLRDEMETLSLACGQVALIGISCTHRPHVDGPRLEKLVPAAPTLFTILLYHTPDLAPIAARRGIDLQLSGHTHGGQVRIPGFGALVTGSLYGKRFEAGRLTLGQMVLYVTRGIGMEGASAPRLRLFCPPEIILWEIRGTVPAEAPGQSLLGGG